ncbi:hypothetical protein TPHA_0K00360 [Tetrapisispora phaffii CBS 4417]|uniref:Homeobox domain-containing protein n=1 Tax=Tetrapisispora phaffii (strain ATCC 24235 / CBS 4417 / NBRC 1672 / NRRL Y-8282 / UCD 70-5) TaxID=1071381 RepID=G8BZ42_TETPH|nr:hypothetical protein TPHA_0K00360 [Tetrapisispora phaffii CBS 4417]CCE65170.1 hypothetical protein TPHA_0K00360 [Tetrapisispora phaffii CBS 4417]
MSTQHRLPSLDILLQASEFQRTLENDIPKANILLSMRKENFSSQAKVVLPPINVSAMNDVSDTNHNVSSLPPTPAATPSPNGKTCGLDSSDNNSEISSPTPLRSGSVSCSPKREFAFITHSKKSYPSKKPRVDNEQLARRKRRKTSQHELDILNEQFKLSQTIGRTTRMELANKCSMSEKAVQIWFQNKRQAIKKQQNKLQDNHLKIRSIVTLKDNHPIHTVSSSNGPKKETRHEIVMTSPKSKVSLPSPRSSPVTASSKGPQALTFHISSNDKTLKAVNKSSNNRVNKLINKYNSSLDKVSNSDNSLSIKKFKLAFKSSGSLPLKEINQNML